MKYEFSEWKTELIQDPNILMSKLKELNIKDKKIKNIIVLGLAYNLTEDEATATAYNYYKKTGVDLTDREIRNYNQIDENVEFLRYVEIDEPIIIEFEDGSRFEIDYCDGSTIKIGLNTLPKNIEWGINHPNVDGNVVFSNCINKTVIGFEVSMQDEMELTYDFTGSHGVDLSEDQDAYIASFRLLLSDCLAIVFNNFVDYGQVIVQEKNNNYSKILWKDLKNGIKDM